MDSDLKISTMRYRDLERLSILLRPSSLGKDWRSFADIIGFTVEEIRWLEEERDPVITLFKKWETGIDKFIPANFQEMTMALKQLKRFDVIEELADIYSRLQKENITDAEVESTNIKQLTVHEKYDVFISYSHEDVEFAKLLLKKLESSPNNFNVCIDFKDFLPGYSSLEQIVEIIENKCKKVIVVLSENYVKCEMCEYQAQIALMLSPAAKKRIVIPIVYRKCEIPKTLKLLYHLDYTDETLRGYFYPRLIKSLIS